MSSPSGHARTGRPPPERTPTTLEARNTLCANCGREFWCGANTNRCWCDGVVISKEGRRLLAQRNLPGCLCPDCLADLGDPT